jgi:hypothetical protein
MKGNLGQYVDEPLLLDVLIDQDRVSVRIDQHQTGRAGGGFDERPAAGTPNA